MNGVIAFTGEGWFWFLVFHCGLLIAFVWAFFLRPTRARVELLGRRVNDFCEEMKRIQRDELLRFGVRLHELERLVEEGAIDEWAEADLRRFREELAELRGALRDEKNSVLGQLKKQVSELSAAVEELDGRLEDEVEDLRVKLNRLESPSL